MTFHPRWEHPLPPLLPHASLALSIQAPTSNWLCHEWYLETYLSSSMAFCCNCTKCLFRMTSSKDVIFFCIFWRVELGSWKSSSKVWFRVAAFSIISMDNSHQSFNRSLKVDSTKMEKLRTFFSEASFVHLNWVEPQAKPGQASPHIPIYSSCPLLKYSRIWDHWFI